MWITLWQWLFDMTVESRVVSAQMARQWLCASQEVMKLNANIWDAACFDTRSAYLANFLCVAVHTSSINLLLQQPL